jgi:hypothetical protein
MHGASHGLAGLDPEFLRNSTEFSGSGRSAGAIAVARG